MLVLPFGAFLAGALLTLLLPVGVLLALGIWYARFTRSVPETSATTRVLTDPNEATPAPHIPEPLPADPAT